MVGPSLRAARHRGNRPARWRLVLALLIVLAVVAVVLGRAAQSASAAQPERVPLKGTNSFYFQFDAGDICPFAISLDFYRTEGSFFAYRDGRTRMAYTYWVSITNLDKGTERVEHEAGSIVTTPVTETVISGDTMGKELSIFAPGDLGPGEPGAMLFITGRSREVDDFPGPHPNKFGVTTLSFEILSGSAENLCETMA